MGPAAWLPMHALPAPNAIEIKAVIPCPALRRRGIWHLCSIVGAVSSQTWPDQAANNRYGYCAVQVLVRQWQARYGICCCCLWG